MAGGDWTEYWQLKSNSAPLKPAEASVPGIICSQMKDLQGLMWQRGNWPPNGISNRIPPICAVCMLSSPKTRQIRIYLFSAFSPPYESQTVKDNSITTYKLKGEQPRSTKTSKLPNKHSLVPLWAYHPFSFQMKGGNR